MTDTKRTTNTQTPVTLDRGAYFCAYSILIPALIFGGIYRLTRPNITFDRAPKDVQKTLITLSVKNDSIIAVTQQQIEHLDTKIKTADSDSVKQDLLKQEFEILRRAREQITENWKTKQSIAKRAGIIR